MFSLFGLLWFGLCLLQSRQAMLQATVYDACRQQHDLGGISLSSDLFQGA